MTECHNVVVYKGNDILSDSGLSFKKKWSEILEDDEKREINKQKKEIKKKKVQKLKEKENTGRLQGDDVDKVLLSKAGREIFIGNLIFDDLESIWPIKKRFNIRDERRKKILDMLSLFGDVIEIRTLWKRGCAFIVLRDTVQAENALIKFNNYEERKRLCKLMKQKAKEEGISELAAPRPSFYLRWPHNHLESNKEIAESKQIAKEDVQNKETIPGDDIVL